METQPYRNTAEFWRSLEARNLLGRENTAKEKLDDVLEPADWVALDSVLDGIEERGYEFRMGGEAVDSSQFVEYLKGRQPGDLRGVRVASPGAAQWWVDELDDLRLLDATTGGAASLTATEEELLVLETGLREKGVTFGVGYGDNPPALTPDLVDRLTSPRRSDENLKTYYGGGVGRTVRDLDDFRALAYFQGVGSSEGLEAPQVAQGLQQLTHEGWTITGSTAKLDPFEAYSRNRSGREEPRLTKGSELSLPVVEVTTSGTAGSLLSQLEEHFPATLEPLARKYNAPKSRIETVVDLLMQAPERVPMKSRLEIYTRLDEALNHSLQRKELRPHNLKKLFLQLVQRDSNAPGFQELIGGCARLLRDYGTDGIGRAMDFESEVPALSRAIAPPVAEFMRLNGLGLVGALTDQKDPSPAAERLELAADLNRVLSDKENENVLHHYCAAVAFRIEGEPLKRAGARYRMLLEQLSGAQQKQAPAHLYRLRTAAEGEPDKADDLVGEFVRALLLGKTPSEVASGCWHLTSISNSKRIC